MTYLLKREFHLFSMYLYFILFFVPINYVMNLPIIYPVIMGMIFSLYNLFYYDIKNNANRTLVSLPIKKKLIVKTRYTFLFLSLIVFILYQWFIDILAHVGLPYLDSAPLNGITVILFFMVISIVLAISLPIFYYFKSFTKAAIIHISFLFVSAFSFAIVMGNPFIDISIFIMPLFKLIDFQPFIIPIILALISLFISYTLSAWIFAKRDIV